MLTSEEFFFSSVVCLETDTCFITEGRNQKSYAVIATDFDILARVMRKTGVSGVSIFMIYQFFCIPFDQWPYMVILSRRKRGQEKAQSEVYALLEMRICFG